MNKNKCFVEKKHWWDASYYDHEWAYKNKEERICTKCKRKEIFFRTTTYGDDWRLKL